MHPVARYVIALGFGFVPSVEAQIVRGSIADQATKAPLGSATVSLLDGRDSVVAEVVTSADGAFIFHLTRAGMYSIGARRIGYAPILTTPAPLAAGDTLAIALELEPIPVALDTVRTNAKSQGLFHVTPGRDVLAKHVALGKGLFVTGWQIQKSGLKASEYLATLPGLQLVMDCDHRHVCVLPAHVDGDNLKALVSTMRGLCLHWRIDHQIVTGNIDQVLKVKDIVAVEVVPESFGSARRVEAGRVANQRADASRVQAWVFPGSSLWIRSDLDRGGLVVSVPTAAATPTRPPSSRSA